MSENTQNYFLKHLLSNVKDEHVFHWSASYSLGAPSDHECQPKLFGRSHAGTRTYPHPSQGLHRHPNRPASPRCGRARPLCLRMCRVLLAREYPHDRCGIYTYLPLVKLCMRSTTRCSPLDPTYLVSYDGRNRNIPTTRPRLSKSSSSS